MARRRRKPQRGEGIGDFFKGIHNFIKNNHLISTGANLLSSVIPDPRVKTIAGVVGSTAGSLGYGHRRGRGRRRAMPRAIKV